jgi:hypothetical protein
VTDASWFIGTVFENAVFELMKALRIVIVTERRWGVQGQCGFGLQQRQGRIV